MIGLDPCTYGQQHIIFDPCAGEGEAVEALRNALFSVASWSKGQVIACEMEHRRALRLAKRFREKAYDRTIEADAFALTWNPGAMGASLLFLNPPYDQDREFGRLEQRFLHRFTGALADGGALLFVLPLSAIAASAAYLDQHYTEIQCWRFPDPDFDAYKQVVILARKLPAAITEMRRPGPGAAMIASWAEYPARLTTLPAPDPKRQRLRVAAGQYHLPLIATTVDLYAALAANRPLEGLAVGTDIALQDVVGRSYPSALPPKAAHLASALAGGHFNGYRILPDSPTDPPILLKGMLRKARVESDRKETEEGEVRSITQVETPALEMRALRLDTVQFFEPVLGAEPTGALEIDKGNTRDILDRYSTSLAELMRRMFPALHDPTNPAHQMRLPDLPRRPFRVQYHAIQAGLKLLAQGQNPRFVAEVGTGKTTMAGFIWAAMSPRFHDATVSELQRVGFTQPRLPVVRRALVMCPPHLISTWQEELAGDEHTPGIAPWARVQVVRAISDLDVDADIYLLSREHAKLGHAYRGVGEESDLLAPERLPAPRRTTAEGDRPSLANLLRRELLKLAPQEVNEEDEGEGDEERDEEYFGHCPDCGQPLMTTADENADKRLRCITRIRLPWNGWARLAQELAGILLPAMPENYFVRGLIYDHRILRYRTGKPRQNPKTDEERQRVATQARETLDSLRSMLGVGPDRSLAGKTSVLREVAALLALPPNEKEKDQAARQAKGVEVAALIARATGLEMPTAEALERLARAGAGDRIASTSPWWHATEKARDLESLARDPEFAQPDAEQRLQALRQALAELISLGKWESRPEFKFSRHRQRLRPRLPITSDEKPKGERCGAHLYCAQPTPRRYPIAKYISRKLGKHFQLLILDEAHEYNNMGTAQSLAAHRLVASGVPVLALTGSMMGGYSSSVFPNWWAMDREFRAQFGRDDITLFVRRYGYQKFVLTPRDGKGGDLQRGKVSDRVEDDFSVKAAGEVPGILPLFILRHLLPCGAIVHKDELDRELPEITEQQLALLPESDLDLELVAEYKRLEQELMNRIRDDMFTKRAGKLWGAMLQLPTYLDRATEDQGAFELRYPKEFGGDLVARGRLFPANYITPKERALLAYLREQLAEGRKSLAFVTNVTGGLPERLHRLIRREATPNVAYLNVARVPAPTRKAWIDAHIVAKGVEVMLVNPNAIRTGLNNLVTFCNGWWHQYDYSAKTYRQANGRLHRIGQTRPVQIRFPHYKDTAQSVAIDLIARKVSASMGFDALTIQGALEASGMQEGSRTATAATMAMGQAIYERLRQAAGARH